MIPPSKSGKLGTHWLWHDDRLDRHRDDKIEVCHKSYRYKDGDMGARDSLDLYPYRPRTLFPYDYYQEHRYDALRRVQYQQNSMTTDQEPVTPVDDLFDRSYDV